MIDDENQHYFCNFANTKNYWYYIKIQKQNVNNFY